MIVSWTKKHFLIAYQKRDLLSPKVISKYFVINAWSFLSFYGFGMRGVPVKGPIWLASHPRSGNTPLRIMLNECFRIVAGSKYDESLGNPSLRHLIGIDGTSRSNVIKTHDYPEEDCPAIYLVRDGRAGIVSYFHYYKNFVEERPMINFLKGEVKFGP